MDEVLRVKLIVFPDAISVGWISWPKFLLNLTLNSPQLASVDFRVWDCPVYFRRFCLDEECLQLGPEIRTLCRKLWVDLAQNVIA